MNQQIGNPSRPGEYRVPGGAQIERCRSCQAKIVWTLTSKNKPIPLSMATVRTDAQGVRWALSHFADCPQAAQHRKPAPESAAPKADTSTMDIRDVPDYLTRHHLVVISSTITDAGDGRLHIELQTRRL